MTGVTRRSCYTIAALISQDMRPVLCELREPVINIADSGRSSV